jgi:hypothetical protein
MKTVLQGIRSSAAGLLIGALVWQGAVAADSAMADSKKAAAKEQAVAVYTQDLIDAMDADKNHEVSKAEFLDFMSKEFDRLDVNHDGKLQQSEILNKPLMGQQKSSVSHR